MQSKGDFILFCVSLSTFFDLRHIWSYLRVVLSCMERMDLVQLSANEKIEELAQALNLQLLS
jgi:hypothetical protein